MIIEFIGSDKHICNSLQLKSLSAIERNKIYSPILSGCLVGRSSITPALAAAGWSLLPHVLRALATHWSR